MVRTSNQEQICLRRKEQSRRQISTNHSSIILLLLLHLDFTAPIHFFLLFFINLLLFDLLPSLPCLCLPSISTLSLRLHLLRPSSLLAPFRSIRLLTFSVNLRDDILPILLDLRQLTGDGGLRPALIWEIFEQLRSGWDLFCCCNDGGK